MKVAFNSVLEFQTTSCITCGCVISLPSGLHDQRLKDHQNFYCPNGHAQIFAGETVEERLKKELEQAQRRIAFEREAKGQVERALQKEQAAAAKLKKRISAGVCPCCQRTVSQLARHIASKHPSFKQGGQS